MSDYPDVLIHGPWVRVDKYRWAQDETVRRLLAEVIRLEKAAKETLRPKPWALPSVGAESQEEGRWQ